MVIGVPKEIKNNEYRVAIVPSAALELTRRGHTVLLETGAGARAGFPDEEYADAGAVITDADTIYERRKWFTR